ncbi:efflux RND transporter periplasmic adaptor subunit [soil metagenome]
MQTNLLWPKTSSPPSSAPVGSRDARQPRKLRRAILKVVFALILVFVLIFGIKALQIRKMMAAGKGMQMPPTTVTSYTVDQVEWQPRLSAVGTLSPVQGATISAEMAGAVSEIAFQSGAPVKAGDMLLKLDTAAEEAQLRSAQADLQLAQNDYDRARDLAQRRVISKSELDAAAARFAQAQAAVENVQSAIAKKQIRAPFDGIAGIREVNVGQMVPVGQRLVTLQALGSVYVDFSLPQQHLADVKPGFEVKVQTDAIPEREFTGELTAVNSAVDPATRAIAFQATLANPEHLLRAGMFARVQVVLPQKNVVLRIPATAVMYAPFGNSVYIIEPQKDEKSGEEKLVLRQQFIRTGETRGDLVAVTEGLQPNQQVVSTGVFKLRNGLTVVIDNKFAPEFSENPKVPNT